MRQRAVLHDLLEARFGLLLDTERFLHGVVGGGAGSGFRLGAHLREEPAFAGVEAGLALQAHLVRELRHQIDARVAIPCLQQRVGGVAHLLGHMEPGGVLAGGALALDQADMFGAGHGQGDQQAFLHAPKARDRHDFLQVEQPLSGVHDLLARDDDLAVGGAHGLDAAMQQLGVVGTMGLKRARGAHGGARAAADALLRRDDQLVVVIGNAARCAHLRAFYARGIAIAHDGAAVLVNRDIGALKFFEQTEEILGTWHCCPFLVYPPLQLVSIVVRKRRPSPRLNR